MMTDETVTTNFCLIFVQPESGSAENKFRFGKLTFCTYSVQSPTQFGAGRSEKVIKKEIETPNLVQRCIFVC